VVAADEEEAHKAAVSATGHGSETLLAQFSVLDNRIAKVGRTAAHVGDRLSAVDAARARADEAADLISALALFDTDGTPVLGPLFVDDARLADAVTVTPRLLQLAEVGAGSGLTSCARALQQLQTYANSLENRLVARFDAAQQARDVPAMAAAADLLVRFNGGASAVARFVATRPMFLSLGPGGVGGPSADAPARAAAPETEADACDLAATAVRTLGAQFKELLKSAKEEAATVNRVFPAPGRVMATLVQRLLEQRVWGAVDAAMEAMPEGGKEATAPARLARLLLLAGAYERTAEMADRLAALPGCGGSAVSSTATSPPQVVGTDAGASVSFFDARGAADELFVPWRESYLDEELATQRLLGESDPPGCAGAQARLHRAPDALARCALLVRAPRARASAAAALVHALCVEIIRTVRAGLDAACTQASTRCKSHGPTTSAQQCVADGPGALLQDTGVACAVMAGLRSYLADDAAPLLALDAGARATAADIARQTGTFVEDALSSTVAAAVGLACGAVERLLLAEQSKADFAPKLAMGGGSGSADGQLTADRPTVACYRATSLLGMVRSAAIAAGLDDRNVAALCASLGDRLVVILDGHFATFKYTPAGGLRLKRDVTEYTTLFTSWGLHPDSSSRIRLARMGALANLLVAPPTELPGLVNGEGLGVAVKRSDAVAMLLRRSDFSRTKRPFSQLL